MLRIPADRDGWDTAASQGALSTVYRKLVRGHPHSAVQPRSGAGRDNDAWLAELARLRGAAAPDELTHAAERAASRDDLLSVGRRLYAWRLEMTRERQ